MLNLTNKDIWRLTFPCIWAIISLIIGLVKISDTKEDEIILNVTEIISWFYTFIVSICMFSDLWIFHRDVNESAVLLPEENDKIVHIKMTISGLSAAISIPISIYFWIINLYSNACAWTVSALFSVVITVDFTRNHL